MHLSNMSNWSERLWLHMCTHFGTCLCWGPAVGGYAGVVCSSVSCQREERSHYVRSVRHRDPEGDWDQQPTAPTQTPTGHPRNGVPHQPLCATHLQNGKYTCNHQVKWFKCRAIIENLDVRFWHCEEKKCALSLRGTQGNCTSFLTTGQSKGFSWCIF